VSSIPHDAFGANHKNPETFSQRWAAFLRRNVGAIGFALGLLALSLVAGFALSPGLLCRWTGYDCAAATSEPQSQPGDACDIGRGKGLTEINARERAGACRLALAARTIDETRGAHAQAEQENLLAAYKWRQAKECAAAAPACGARDCYAAYLSEFGDSGGHASDARAEQGRLEAACRALLLPSAADGRYLARSQAACGAKPASVVVEIKDGEIAWRYELAGIVYQWRGLVDAAGAIQATVGGAALYSGSGRFTDAERVATMTYPQCPSGISMRILNKIPD
jgi:hypothetical protein